MSAKIISRLLEARDRTCLDTKAEWY